MEPHPSARRDTSADSRQLRELLTALEQALVAETEAMRARDVDELGRAVESKRSALALLACMERKDVGSLDDEIAKLLARCRVLNDSAGSAIAVLRQDTNHALALLGIDSETPGYGSPGSPRRKGRALAVC